MLCQCPDLAGSWHVVLAIANNICDVIRVKFSQSFQRHSSQLSDKDLVFTKPRTATGPSATDSRNHVSKISRVAPQNSPGFNTQGGNIVGAGYDIHDPFMDNGLCFPLIPGAGPRVVEMCTPNRAKLVDVVSVNLRQC